MKKRYSTYIPYLSLIIDLFIINFSLLLLEDKNYLNTQFLVYINLFWIISSLITNTNKNYRYYNYFKILSLLAGQIILFVLGFFTYFSLFREGDVVHNQTKVLVTIIVTISVAHLIFFYLLKKYRSYGKNFRKIVVLGFDESTVELTDMFKNEKELGYQFLGFFTDNKTDATNFLGSLKQYENYVLNNNVDEIYCSLSELKNKQIKKIKKFAIRHKRKVKLIPNANELYNKNTVTEFYGDSLVVLNVKQLPFEFVENRIIKRIFDVFFSVFVCVFIISWLYPILWILIKLESKGPVIFKQKREGINGKEFLCYKFRSMRLNELYQGHTVKDDSRVTKLGRVLRKTSIDEIPQFFNVLLGDMSVVGPRPHMDIHSKKFDREVANYMERKSVKPGITGLAQISGYRGEIIKQADIINRVRFDVFYIENWSLMLDVKIIIKTILNILTGEEKAY